MKLEQEQYQELDMIVVAILILDMNKEEYEYKKLIVTLKKKEMDEVVIEIFKDYPDNVVHYESLLEAKGNMGDVFGSGNGMMIHARDPIRYTSINSKHWKSHFYGFGRSR